MAYKVGQVVRIVGNSKKGPHHFDMGEKVKITKIDESDDLYRYRADKLDNSDYYYVKEKEIEEIKEEDNAEK